MAGAALAEAAAAAGSEAAKALVLEARWAAGAAVRAGEEAAGAGAAAGPGAGRVQQQLAAGVGGWLLAEAEALRARPDKASEALAHALPALLGAGARVPGAVRLAAGKQLGSWSEVAGGVHQEPWAARGWQLLGAIQRCRL
jgi:hypothetical protein